MLCSHEQFDVFCLGWWSNRVSKPAWLIAALQNARYQEHVAASFCLAGQRRRGKCHGGETDFVTDYCSCVRHMFLKRWQETLRILERQHSDARVMKRGCARSVADCWQVDRETLALLVKEAMAKRLIGCERARS